MAGTRYVTSKLKKNGILLQNKEIRSHIPPTRSFTVKRFQTMLRRYGMVYLKPVHGLKGIGIMRAEKTGRAYRLRQGVTAVRFRSFRELRHHVVRRIRRKSYLVQRGIWTLRSGGRPFDFRIMVQLNERKKWEVTGIVARVAPPNRIVTNRSQGGQCLPASRVLRSSMRKPQAARYQAFLFSLSRKIGKQFRKGYPRAWQLGVDVAVGRNRKAWILEVNTNPAVTPFVVLGNRRMYKRMLQLVRLHTKGTKQKMAKTVEDG
ncbi:YheC/YheD family protein [Cohnella candidum]|uniref:YheC/YheD family protein n=1 Tax=Cohnella candidum TaxID=2674991 RepID=UPI0013DE1E9F|nr:YheC/YheD family protein [Cohnella candidum]